MHSYDELSPIDDGAAASDGSESECVYLNSNLTCSILRIQQCQADDCSFRRTRDEFLSSDAAAAALLNSLSEDQQEKIAGAYYSGKRPWKAQPKQGE